MQLFCDMPFNISGDLLIKHSFNLFFSLSQFDPLRGKHCWWRDLILRERANLKYPCSKKTQTHFFEIVIYSFYLFLNSISTKVNQWKSYLTPSEFDILQYWQLSIIFVDIMDKKTRRIGSLGYQIVLKLTYK